MKILDLFCGAGGAGMGYHRAGFEVEGLDLNNQRHYPFAFTQADALKYLRESWLVFNFDAIHASPPCQSYSITKHTHSVEYPDLMEPVRELLEATRLPYVIENVPGAPMHNPVTLCGTMFGLTATDTDGTKLHLKRHRLFESNIPLGDPPPCRCKEMKREGWLIGGVYGGGSPTREAAAIRKGGYTPPIPVRRELMQMDWGTIKQLSEAIPPAYTEWVGKRLIEHLA